MSGCQRCLVCGCLAVGDVLCVRMSGCQRCLVCECLAVIDVLCATGDCVLKQRSQPAAVSIPLFNFVTIAYITKQNEYVRVVTENPNNMTTVIGGLQHITDDGDVSFIVTEDAVMCMLSLSPHTPV